MCSAQAGHPGIRAKICGLSQNLKLGAVRGCTLDVRGTAYRRAWVVAGWCGNRWEDSGRCGRVREAVGGCAKVLGLLWAWLDNTVWDGTREAPMPRGT